MVGVLFFVGYFLALSIRWCVCCYEQYLTIYSWVTVAFSCTEGAEINVKDNNGNTALIWASQEGETDVVRALLGAGEQFWRIPVLPNT